MKPFLDAEFLLESEVASDLFHRFAESLPIIDYHCHLSPDLMANDHRFRSITEIWLDGDHYKWRAMRANGVPEKYCTGDASDWEKFEAWARTVPDAMRSPLYHWTHMELRRPFGVTALLSGANAREVFDRCNARLREDGFTALGLLRSFKVAVVCTTDDPVDSLEPHRRLADRPNPETRVYPTWRPDRALAVEDTAAFNGWVARLEQASGVAVGGRLPSFLDALEARHAFFHELGCRASDHGLETIFAEPWADRDVEASFDRVRSGRALDQGAALVLKSALVHRLALLDHARGWVQQFHLGALRNNNTRLRRALGPDTGFDSIGDFEVARPLSRFLDRLDETNQLAKTILYNLNPRDNGLLAAMIGNFQDGSVPGKMQYGSAWWFLDQLDGMTAQMNALSNMGLLSRFVGMVTDSRSFLSYSRHEYFRRLLCNLLGEDVRRGLLPDERETLGAMVQGVSFFNARDYFGFPLGRAAAGVERAGEVARR
jgi:glucuronate isomerase